MGQVKIFGPYKGSKQNGGRPIYVIKRKKKDGTTETTSTNKARLDYKKATGKKLKRNQEVDHKDNGGRKGDPRQKDISRSNNPQAGADFIQAMLYNQ